MKIQVSLIKLSQIKFASLILKYKCWISPKLTKRSQRSQPTKLSQLTKLVLPFLIFNFSFLINTSSQSRDQWLKQLTDSSFHGRGYVHQGDRIAADYLEQEFKKLGALPIKKSYRQFYHHDVNTFPDSMRITVNGESLVPGEDYIVDNRSGSCFGNYDKVILFDLKEYPDMQKIKSIGKEKCAVIWDFTAEKEGIDEVEKGKIRLDAMNAIYELAKTVPVIILQSTKLTWSVGKNVYALPIIYCRKEKFLEETVNTISFGINNQMKHKYQSSNVYGMVKAKKKWKKKKYLVFSAHFDHLGRMGEKTYFPGANDNASGTTMLLCLMEYYSKAPPEEFNVVFIGFSGEEAGLRGSEYFIKNSPIPIQKIAFVMNMDIMGTGDEGITVVNATKYTEEFELLEKINAEKNYLVKIKKRGETSNSDHYWFDKNGVKSFFIYTMGGIQAYHDVYDKFESLPLTEFEDLKKMLIEFSDRLFLKK